MSETIKPDDEKVKDLFEYMYEWRVIRESSIPSKEQHDKDIELNTHFYLERKGFEFNKFTNCFPETVTENVYSEARDLVDKAYSMLINFLVQSGSIKPSSITKTY